MTAIATDLTDEVREDEIAALRGVLENLDVQANQITEALHHVRELRRAATALVGIKTTRITLRDTGVEEWYDRKSQPLNVPESTHVVLEGSFKEPIRELIASTDAAEAELLRNGVDNEEQRAKTARALADLRG